MTAAAAADPSGPQNQVVPHAAQAWEFFRKIGSPKFHVAPMVDQFCANDPKYLCKAAQSIEHECDAIDINFGCPQRIARKGYYGAFLMDNLPLVENLVSNLCKSVSIPVTCKIRIFPNLEDTIAYARMIERAGCSVLAVHGRTREQKDNFSTRANWDYIRAVKQALSIPVLANGNVRNLSDALACLEYTGCDGVLSAEGLLDDPALFSPRRMLPGGERTHLDSITLLLEYLHLCLEYPTLVRMMRGHIHKMIGPWLAEHVDLRERINAGHVPAPQCIQIVQELQQRVLACRRTEPIPQPSYREKLREEAIKAAIQEQQREEQALAALDSMFPAEGAACPEAAACT